MKIFVTGSRGFIGSHLVNALSEYELTTFDWNHDKEFPKLEGNYDWVIHLGAISSTTETDVEKIMHQNYDFSVSLFELCREQNINFQYASSASVYGLGDRFDEEAPVDPRTPYAWSKYLFERYVKAYPANHIRVQGFRYFNVYGPEGEEHKGSQASPYAQFKHQAEHDGVIKLFEGSENVKRDFIHVSDVVNTHIKFFHVMESGVWNVGTGVTTSFRDIAEKFNAKIVEIPVPDALKSSYQRYTCADTTKLKQTLDAYNRDFLC